MCVLKKKVMGNWFGLVWFGWEEGVCVCVLCVVCLCVVCCVLFKDSLNVVMSNLMLKIN